MRTIIKLIPILCFYFGTAQPAKIQHIEYNNPSLQPVDLYAGLWKWLPLLIAAEEGHLYLLKNK